MGCGNGKVLTYICRCMPGIELYGVDKSEKQCRKLKRKFSGHGNVNIIFGDFLKGDFEIVPVDMVLIIEVIEHLDMGEVFALLQALCFKLRAKYILVTTPNKDYNKNLDILTEKGLRNKDHKFEFTYEELIAFMERCTAVFCEYDIHQEYCDKSKASYSIIFERKNHEKEES